jgi:addiction module HigA family antidote
VPSPEFAFVAATLRRRLSLCFSVLNSLRETLMPKKLKPVHPGEILREEFMTPLGLSMNKMAMALRVPVTRIADIVNERRGITADTALRFARYFKNAPAFWMNLQTRYNLEVAEDGIPAKVARDVQPLEAVTAPEA